MQLSPYENGIHSIAEGLRSLELLFSDLTNPYLMKDVIVKTHHGIETLFKDILFQQNPVFVLIDKTTVPQIIEYYKGYYKGSNDYLLDDATTINPTEALKRIRTFNFGDFTEKEYSQLSIAFESINAIRNKIQHFTVSIHSETIIKSLANLIPQSLKLIDSCYGMNAHNKISEKVNRLPYMISPGTFGASENNIYDSLNIFFANSKSTIYELETKYNINLHKAVRGLKNKNFANKPLTISLKDRGLVGSPPHMPRFTLSGWLNGTFDAHKNSTERYFPDEKVIALYNAQTSIGRLELIKKINDQTSRVKIRFSINSSIEKIDAASFFQIDEAVDHFEFIREPTINIAIELEVDAIAFYDPSNFHILTISSLKGTASVHLASCMYGETSETPSVSGQQDIELNGDNTELTFHSFLKTNGDFCENYAFDMSFKGVSDITFN